MSTTHISREQLVQYRNRALLPQELVAVDGHLGRCQECRTELAGLAASGLPAAEAAEDDGDGRAGGGDRDQALQDRDDDELERVQ